MTEEEAKRTTCWRSMGTGTLEPCRGSQCMAWRWDEGTFFDPKRNLHVHDISPHGVGIAGGFCGPAGKP